MTVLPAQNSVRPLKARRRGRWALAVIGGLLAAGAIAAISYLLWPTYRQTAASSPERIPVSVGSTVFNVPAPAFRIKVQKHSGPQERVDLWFVYPSLEPPDAPRRVSADAAEDAAVQSIDRVFLIIAAHGGALAPEARARAVYPRYLLPPTQSDDGLTTQRFKDESPYAGDDLIFAGSPAIAARCSRDGATPGMCLSERRIGGADLTYRFPRQWLSGWRDVAAAMDRLTTQLTMARN